MASNPNKFLGRVKEVEWFTDKVVKVTIDNYGEISYDPGQFIVVEVSVTDERAYGISNYREKTGVKEIELLVDISPGGVGSKYFEKIAQNDKIKFDGPYGKFVVTENDCDYENIVFFATGTGVAPLKAMIEALLNGQVVSDFNKDVYLIFGLRYKEDRFLCKYFESLAKKFDNFKFCLTLSKPDKQWKGECGYVTEHVCKEIRNLKSALYFICGGPRAVTGIHKYLKDKGVEEENIRYEKF